MMGVVNFGNGIEIDLGTIQKCAVNALKAIEIGLPQEVRCKVVYDQIIEEMKRNIDTSIISISPK